MQLFWRHGGGYGDLYYIQRKASTKQVMQKLYTRI